MTVNAADHGVGMYHLLTDLGFRLKKRVPGFWGEYGRKSET